MIPCTSCGNDVTGKKFCPDCGTPVQPISPQGASGQFLQTCSHCGGEVKPGASFCTIGPNFVEFGAILLAECEYSAKNPRSAQYSPWGVSWNVFSIVVAL